MTTQSTRGSRAIRVALASAMLGVAALSGTVTASDVESVDIGDPQLVEPGQVTRISGLDPTVAAGLLQEHFRLEHRADLVRVDPVIQAERLAAHFEIEHRADLLRGTLVDPVMQAAWLAHHFAIEHGS